MLIILQPISFQLLAENNNIFSLLEKHLSREFDGLSVNTAQLIKEVPSELFDKHRNQWKSTHLLKWLLEKYKPDRRIATKILAICSFDAYSNGLNFVFGEAYLDGTVLAIYLPRLRQEFYGLKADEFLFSQRIIKEAVHELGHAFGLNHCEKVKCVMHFSNSLRDTDIKEENFCNTCKVILRRRGR